VDFWQPGTPVYNYTIGHTVGATPDLRTNGVSWSVPPVVTNTGSGSTRSATIIGAPFSGLQFQRAISFAQAGQVITITDTLTNTGAVTLTNVATLDNTDPDPISFTTLNDVAGGAVFAEQNGGG
jgi:uncharacterized repeat protein (TIGR01451 family)